MSISAVSAVGGFQPEAMQGRFQKVKSEFQQLGQDLQSGNLSQAQADFATLSKDLPPGQQNTNNPLRKDFNAVSQALQSGDLASAQQAFSTLQTDLQSAGKAHHHHHHHSEGQGGGSSAVTQDVTQLGQSLQAGDLAGAQKAFSTLQNDLQKYRDNAQTLAANNSTTATSNLSVTG